ncbi:RRM motif-containing protein [Naegleria gruberi]|uniref:RRM motif-containing protein n=1 Tax=Naegleria gruberi TaxID=5762 RepID=D2UYU4_NAEGR|nr:RRM motif-containing protein [Naegleria gruberi]EFC50848.1 RRM motif-containing protein [Naegleria gruberi]|eukprot:XP_002683592.1 RRM motif-containing protein [Naegleria gruberi strain NEG-M]
MKRAKQINELNQKELSLGYTNTPSSWHHQEKNRTAYIYIGGLDFRLTEGDLLSVFSQYGEIVDIDLVREEQELTSKGFCFIAYEDVRSTILAIDNLNGIELGGRIICVDHAPNYYKKIVEDPEEQQNSGRNGGRNSSSTTGRFNNRYQQDKKENVPKYETMEKDGMIYKKVKKANDDFEWTLYHDAMKKRDPNWLHKYLMMTMFEGSPSNGRHDSSDEEEDGEDEGSAVVKSPTQLEKKENEEPKKKLSKEEKKRKKEEKKERKELKKLKKMEEKMFGGLNADI